MPWRPAPAPLATSLWRLLGCWPLLSAALSSRRGKDLGENRSFQGYPACSSPKGKPSELESGVQGLPGGDPAHSTAPRAGAPAGACPDREALVQLNSEASEAPPSFKEILKAEARVLNTGTQRSLKNLILQEGVFTSVLGLCCVISQPSAEEGNQIHFSLERSTISRPNRWGWSLFFPLSLLLGPVFPF